MLGKPFPEKWSDEFRPAGLSIPLEGDKNKLWDVTFECLTNNSGFLFTSYFEDGEPSGITVDT